MTSTQVFARSGIEVRQGPRGRGVFAARPFAKGEAVEVCPTVELPGSEANGTLADYVFDSGRGDSSVVLLLGYGMLYNHSYDPNLDYEQEGTAAVAFVATRDIAPGEELTITYGEEWWVARGIEPVDDAAPPSRG